MFSSKHINESQLLGQPNCIKFYFVVLKDIYTPAKLENEK